METTSIILLLLATQCLLPDAYGQEMEGGNEKVVSEVSKCCQPKMVFSEARKCETSDLEFNPEFTGPVPDEVDLIVGLNCEFDRFALSPEEDAGDEFQLLSNGSLYLPKLATGPLVVEPGSYCLETLVDPERGPYTTALLCFPAPEDPEWNRFTLSVYPIGCSISVPFLLLTAVIYASIKELNDLQGKVITGLTFCLAFAFIFLAIVQTQGNRLPPSLCIVMAFMLQFFFLSSFFWMNVMCYHTWWKTRLGLKCKPSTVAMEKKRFRYYSLYGWSIPALILVISIIMNSVSLVPSSLTPSFGATSCWFQTDAAAAIYFYGPVGVVLFLNVVFFMMITYKKYRSQKRSGETGNELSRITWNHIKNRRMRKFKEILTLFCVMGLTWTLELISWVSGGPNGLWLFTDLLNTLQGPILFYLFVWHKKRAKKLAIERLLKCRWPSEEVRKESLLTTVASPAPATAPAPAAPDAMTLADTVTALIKKNGTPAPDHNV